MIVLQLAQLICNQNCKIVVVIFSAVTSFGLVSTELPQFAPVHSFIHSFTQFRHCLQETIDFAAVVVVAIVIEVLA